MALLAVQLDQLEGVATAVGRAASTVLAAEFAAQVQRSLRVGEVILPIGEKKFWILLQRVINQGHAELAAGLVGRVGKGPFQVSAHKIRLEPVAGIALFPDHAADATALARAAELALSAARSASVAFRTFQVVEAGDIADLWAVEHEFDRALDEAEFELYFQPKIDLRTGQPCSAEALLRWKNPSRGLLAPGAFLAVAEKCGRLEAITRFVIDAAQRQRSEWPARFGRLPVAINVPPSVLDSGRLEPYLMASLPIWGSIPADIILEITEDSVGRNPERSFAALAHLREQGVRVSIDDFGSGYSSFASFKDMPADELKIDKSLVRNIERDEGNQYIVRAMIELAHQFGYEVVAEGVETEASKDILTAMQCDAGQGFLFARPQAQKAFVDWLAAYAPARNAG
jgi:EAL domain-containing protein (putative c-di-GMP-specific phosphodiesterase class I)/GGDEF domain-containing protein